MLATVDAVTGPKRCVIWQSVRPVTGFASRGLVFSRHWFNFGFPRIFRRCRHALADDDEAVCRAISALARG
jgi:hypothetical protein